jgi:hypothetical protein
MCWLYHVYGVIPCPKLEGQEGGGVFACLDSTRSSSTISVYEHTLFWNESAIS